MNNNKINKCGCKEVEFCGCTTKLDLLCTYYEGDTLDTLGIKKGMNGKEVITIINDYLKNILQNLDIPPAIIESVGEGVVVYKGLSEEFIHQFKSLVHTEGIFIESESDKVNFSIDKDWLENKILESIQANPVNNSLDFKFSSAETPGTPDSQPSKWSSTAVPLDKWMAIKEIIDSEPGDWKVVKIQGDKGKDGIDGIDGENGTPGVTSRNTIVFKRARIQPATPTGGSFIAPTPSGWVQGIPPLIQGQQGPVWQSSRIFTDTGVYPQESAWSTPVIVVDSETIDYEFSNFTGTSPGTPSTPLNGALWHNEGLADDIWMAFRTLANGVAGAWSVVRIKGETGPAGANGSGLSVISNNPVQSIAVGADGVASIETEFSVTFSVYSNATPLSPMTEPLTEGGFSIITPSSPLAGISVTKINGNTLKYSIAAGTEFGDLSITSTVNIKVGAANTIVKSSFIIIPVKTAEDSESLTITADSNMVKYDNFGNLDTPTSITIRAQQQNYTETITWSSVPVGIVTGTGTTKTINSSTFFNGAHTSVKVRIETPNGLFDETTIVKIQDGRGGAPGLNGTSGPTPRLLEFVIDGEYENGGDFIDYAYYRTNDINEGWYTVKVVGGVRTVVTYPGGAPNLTKFDKAPFTKEMSFGTVIAEQANLAGFIFRNQVLQSQKMSYQSCSATNDRGPFPNLLLDGRQGIIKFLEKMVLSKDGIAIKDDCGNNRMVFMFENGVPVLKFFDSAGNVVWEAGQNNFGGVTTAFFAPQIGFKTSIAISEAPPISSTPISEAISYIATIDGQYKVKESNPLVNVYGQKYVKMNPEVPTLPEHNKVFTTASTSSATVTDGWYMYAIENGRHGSQGGFAEGVIVHYVKIIGGVLTEYTSRNYKLAAAIVYRNYSSDLYGGSGDTLYATWIDKNGITQATEVHTTVSGQTLNHSVCAQEGSYYSTGTIREGGEC